MSCCYKIIKNCKRNGYPEEQLEKLYNEYYSYYKEYYSYIASYYGQKYDDYLKAMGTTDEKLKDIPLVIFSSLVNEEMRRKGEQLGADAQLSKPEIGNLVRIIDELLGN